MVDSDIDLSSIERWDPKSQVKAAKMLQSHLEEPPKIWFCAKGRSCNGEPHKGANYPHARGDQWPPGVPSWYVWAMISGRGGGKTRSACEWVRSRSKVWPRIAAVGRRGVDIRATMVEGESGLIYVCERAKIQYDWKPSAKEFTFENGSTVYFYSAEEPDSLRGPQHYGAWLDEPAHMPLITDVWDNLLMGLRLGQDPRIMVTTTPLPKQWMIDLVNAEDTAVTRFSTYANLANLAPTFKKTVLAKYEGTRLGRQELHGEILEDIEGALWTSEMVLNAQRSFDPTLLQGNPASGYNGQDFDSIVIGLDPAGSSEQRSDETGIMVVARLADTFFILEDLSGHYTPDQWASKVIKSAKKWDATEIIAERNYGGDMVETTLRNAGCKTRIKTVNSRQGKAIRAEPIVLLYEQSRVMHVGNLKNYEEQILKWIPGEGRSPDRLDAAVHAITRLSDSQGKGQLASGASKGSSGEGKKKTFTPIGHRRTETGFHLPSRFTSNMRRSMLR